MARKDGKDRGLFQRAGSPDWWIRWSCPFGHDHRERIGPKAVARDEYRRRLVAVKTQGYCLTRARQEKPVLFSEAAKRYLTWATEHRPRSATFREKALKHLGAAFHAKSLGEITRADVEAYQAARREAGAAAGTVNRERSVLSHLFTKAITWGQAKANPVTGTEREQEPAERPRPLTHAEEARLVAVLPAHYRPFVTLALHTGLRLGELRHRPGGT